MRWTLLVNVSEVPVKHCPQTCWMFVNVSEVPVDTVQDVLDVVNVSEVPVNTVSRRAGRCQCLRSSRKKLSQTCWMLSMSSEVPVKKPVPDVLDVVNVSEVPVKNCPQTCWDVVNVSEVPVKKLFPRTCWMLSVFSRCSIWKAVVLDLLEVLEDVLGHTGCCRRSLFPLEVAVLIDVGRCGPLVCCHRLRCQATCCAATARGGL